MSRGLRRFSTRKETLNIGILAKTLLICELLTCAINSQAEVNELQAELIDLREENERLQKDAKRRESTANNLDGNRDRVANRDVINGELPRLIDVEATFYTAFCDTGCTGVTASGYDVSNTIHTPDGLRIIAADTSVIPLKSTVKVTLANGDSFKAQVLDRGGAIKGGRIDILVKTRDEAYKLGRQSATVEIITEGKR